MLMVSLDYLGGGIKLTVGGSRITVTLSPLDNLVVAQCVGSP